MLQRPNRGPLYFQRGKTSAGLPIYRCIRGTNSTEVGGAYGANIVFVLQCHFSSFLRAGKTSCRFIFVCVLLCVCRMIYDSLEKSRGFEVLWLK